MGELAKFLRWVISNEAPNWVNFIAIAVVVVITVSAFLGAVVLFVVLLATGHYTLTVLLFLGAPVAACYVAYLKATK